MLLLNRWLHLTQVQFIFLGEDFSLLFEQLSIAVLILHLRKLEPVFDLHTESGLQKLDAEPLFAESGLQKLKSFSKSHNVIVGLLSFSDDTLNFLED